MPPGVPNPTTLAKARVSQQWAATLREGIIKSVGRDTNLEKVACNVLSLGLHLDYKLDLQNRRVNDIPPPLTPPLPSGFVGDTRQPEKPEIPKKPSSSKLEEGLWGRGWAPAKPDTPGPSHNGEMVPRMQMGGQMEQTG